MIKNQSKNTTIAKDYQRCESIWSKAVGLMFKKQVTTPLVFYFKEEKKHGLHMFFVFCCIDVLFLNKEKEVVDIKENFKPLDLYTPKRKCSYVVELKKGSIQKSNTHVGDQLSF